MKRRILEQTDYTYEDYEKWPEENRYELIDGVVYDMTPAPGRAHQETLGNLYLVFRAYFKEKPCKVYLAPFDVRLPKPGETPETSRTVVQPDLSVICEPEKLDDKGCVGAPTLVVEILSPWTAPKDHVKKKALYEKHGVKEYWLVHPVDRMVTMYRLEPSGAYAPAIIRFADVVVETPLFPGLSVDFSTVFPPNERKVTECPFIIAARTKKPPPKKNRKNPANPSVRCFAKPHHQ